MTVNVYDITKSENEQQTKSISYFKLYRFATKMEIFLIIIGVLCACLNALTFPFMIIIYGEFTTLLVDRAYGYGTSSNTRILVLLGGGKVLTNATEQESFDEIYNDTTAHGILLTLATVFQFITSAISVDIFNYTSLKQISRIRVKFFNSALRQEIAWHDQNTGDNLGSRLTDDMDKVREGMAEKVPMCISLFMCFVASVIIAFIYGWKLTLVCCAIVPLLIITSVLVAKFQSSLTAKELQSYSNAGSVAEEVILGIKTVKAFGGEKKESDRYAEKLIPAEKAGKRRGLWSGIGDGVIKFIYYASNSLAFWYGIKLILNDRDKVDKEYTPAVLMITFFGVLIGSDNLSRMGPFISVFAAARGAAGTIFHVIDRISKIDAMSSEGKLLNYGIRGDIKFESVSFHYPARKDVTVLKNLNLKIKAGHTTAIVGSSGCGKSTCLQLLQRFYDPCLGTISIDGNDIKKFNLSWLRSQIAVVGQEPILFATTIAENIGYGKPGATFKEIENAAKQSSAHDFITELPNGYNTTVGEKGSLLSGGQKQRIAIARALVGNPKILLLDEATSALDSQSEKLVQDALELASKGRTTIIVSHRLSTIRQADRIVVLDNGQIIEDGTHDQLIKQMGHYFKMQQSNIIEDLSQITVDKDEVKSEKDNNLDEDNETKSINANQNNFQYVPSKCDEGIEDDNDKLDYKYLLKRILKLSKPEIPFLILGAVAALIVGISYPAFAILFGDVYGALALHDPDDVIQETNKICIGFLILAIVTGISLFLQTHLLNLSGVHLTTRVRSLLFTSILKQDMGWFDQESNSVGSLSTKLSLDAANIQGAIGYPIGGILQALSTMIAGLTVAFYFSWKLALVCAASIPFVLGSFIFEGRFMSKANMIEKIEIERATQIAMEAVTNIRTVASLNQETSMIARYIKIISNVEKIVRKKTMFRGLVSACGQSMPFLAYALALYYGGILVAQRDVLFQNIIKTSEGLIFGVMMVGQSLAFAPTLTAGLVGAKRVLKVIDRIPLIKSPFLLSNTHKTSNEYTVRYKDIEFSYPKRPYIKILQNLNMEILTGKTVALVGHSGCGKSTCIQLLQRFYDPNSGRIFIDNDDITNDLFINDLRNKLGIVSQEPVLFELTIAENIAYGDNSRKVHIAEVIEAAKIANIHNFIMSLPLSYDTCLGSKGTQLSGGQKQRIAIARALIRNPKILLLDEATSALDSQSEKIVQAALETARAGRTCIVIAHRLSTIKNANLICVLENGCVVESGTHDQLLAKGGHYYKLHKTLQMECDTKNN